MARDFEGCVASARVIDENFNVVMGMAFSAYYLPYQSLALIRLLPQMAGCARLRSDAHHPPQSASSAHLVAACSRELSA